MGKPPRSPAHSAAEKIERDIRFSRHLFIAALLLVAAVAIGDTVYIAMQIAKNRGHIYIPAVVVAAPIAALFFVLLSWWNWRAVLRRPQPPTSHGTPSARR